MQTATRAETKDTRSRAGLRQLLEAPGGFGGGSGPLLRRLQTLLRDPLLAFALLGIGLFAAYSLIQSDRQTPIRFTAEAEAAMVEEFEILSGRKASAADRARMKEDFITRELLLRDAIDRGLHLTSAEVRELLIEKDRYLIAGAPAEPSEEEMVNFYADNLERYQGEPRTTFIQVFRAERPDNGSAILSRLRAGESVPSDDFWLGRTFPDYGDSMVRGIFGQSFIDRLDTASPGAWFGPVKSARGWHFVRVERRFAAERRTYGAVRDQVRQDVMNARTARAIESAAARLKEKYDVAED